MNGSLELSVYKLVSESSFFTQLILFALLVLSVTSWAIMIHKLLFIHSYKAEVSRFLKSLTNKANMSSINESCMQFSKGTAKTIPIIMIRLIRSMEAGSLPVSPVAILNNATMHEANRLKNSMGILATIANISPLIGLLGTVWGVMYSFINIGEQGSASIAVVAPGIAEALMTTIAGLCVAIPAMSGHNLLTVWINYSLDYLDRINEYAVSVLTKRDA